MRALAEELFGIIVRQLSGHDHLEWYTGQDTYRSGEAIATRTFKLPARQSQRKQVVRISLLCDRRPHLWRQCREGILVGCHIV